MGDRCEKCGRPRGLIRMRECGAFQSHLYPTYGYECDAFVAGRERGMREGLAIAKEHVGVHQSWMNGELVRVTLVWEPVDAELERRLRGGDA